MRMTTSLPAGEVRPPPGAAKPPRRPAWLPTAAAVATVAVCVTAGNWQHRRMLEKEALKKDIGTAAAVSPVPLPRGVDDWNAWAFRRVSVAGEYDAAHQILIDNKVHAGRVGFDVVTPLRTADGRVVLVDRGWIVGGPTREVLPRAPAPEGPVTLRGRIEVPSRGYFELGDRRAPAGPIWQHLDPVRFSEATGIAVLPIVIQSQDASAGSDLVRDWPLPDTGIDRHLSYMVQWYTFAAMAAGLWLWLSVWPRLRPRIRSRASR